MPEQPSPSDEVTLEPSIGASLRTARERCGMSVSEVAERTRIRATLVREIEDDDFTGCGASVYARGHVRAIATTVGLDPAPLLAEFDRAQEAGSQPPRAALGPYPPATPAGGRTGFQPDVAPSERSKPNWAAAMITVSGLVAILVVVSFVVSLRGRGEGTQPTTAVGNTIDAVDSDPSPSPSTPSTPSTASSWGTASSPGTSSAPGAPARRAATPSAAAIAPPSGVDLQLRVRQGRSWVRVTDSTGAELYQGVLGPGDAKDFSDDTGLTVRYGNSRVVTVVVNGETLGRPDCGGSVCTDTYEPTSPAG